MIRISTTKLGNHKECRRLHYFNVVMAMPNALQEVFVIGNVVHNALERIYRSHRVGADLIVPEHTDTLENGDALFGQVPGAVLEIFPRFWDYHKERDGSWTRVRGTDEAKIKAMVLKGFETGAIHVPPDPKVEKQFVIPVIPGVIFTSLADCASIAHLEIQDHKTRSAPKWVLSSDQLYDDVQINSYGKYLIEEVKKATGEYPEFIHMCHNNYVKKPPHSSFVTYATAPNGSIDIPVERIHQVWDGIEEQARDMVELQKVERWQDVPLPETREMCDKYATGCNFCSVCFGGVDPEIVRKGIIAKNKTLTVRPPMSPQTQRNATPPLPASAPASPPVAAAPTAPAWPKNIGGKWLSEAAPWSLPGCPLCSGVGVSANAEGAGICPNCLGQFDGEGVPVLTDTPAADGVAMFVVPTLADPNTDPMAPPAPPVVAEAPASVAVEAPVVAEVPAPAPPAPVAPVVPAAPVVESPPPVAGQPPVAPAMVAVAPTVVPPPTDKAPAPAAPKPEKKESKGEAAANERLATALAEGDDQSALDALVGLVRGTPGGRGRAMKRYILCIGCTPVSNQGADVVNLEPIIQGAKELIRMKYNKDHFLDVAGQDGAPWMRRGDLGKLAPGIIEDHLTGKIVVLSDRDTEATDLIKEIEAHAAMVVRG